MFSACTRLGLMDKICWLAVRCIEMSNVCSNRMGFYSHCWSGPGPSRARFCSNSISSSQRMNGSRILPRMSFHSSHTLFNNYCPNHGISSRTLCINISIPEAIFRCNFLKSDYVRDDDS